MSGPDVHRYCGVVAESHTTPTCVQIIRLLTTEVGCVLLTLFLSSYTKSNDVTI